jgi:hypothetical protein
MKMGRIGTRTRGYLKRNQLGEKNQLEASGAKK